MSDPRKGVPDDAPGVEVPRSADDDRLDEPGPDDELARLAEELTPDGENSG